MLKEGDVVYKVMHRLNQIKEVRLSARQAESVSQSILDFNLQDICDIRLFMTKESAIQCMKELNYSLALSYEYDIAKLRDKIDALDNPPEFIVG